MTWPAGPGIYPSTTMEEVKLLGFWASLFSHSVLLWALNSPKGVKFEEDLLNKKSQVLLLQYNPLHKKIPVLVHGAKPIADRRSPIESLVILECIEEMWPENPLLPKHAYERSSGRESGN